MSAALSPLFGVSLNIPVLKVTLQRIFDLFPTSRLTVTRHFAWQSQISSSYLRLTV